MMEKVMRVGSKEAIDGSDGKQMVGALARIAKKLLKEKELLFSGSQEDNVDVFRSNFGLRCFALRQPATILMGLCLDSDVLDPTDYTGNDVQLIAYARYDVGRINTADNTLQMRIWNDSIKLILPDNLEIEDVLDKEPMYQLYLDKTEKETSSRKVVKSTKASNVRGKTAQQQKGGKEIPDCFVLNRIPVKDDRYAAMIAARAEAQSFEKVDKTQASVMDDFLESGDFLSWKKLEDERVVANSVDPKIIMALMEEQRREEDDAKKEAQRKSAPNKLGGGRGTTLAVLGDQKSSPLSPTSRGSKPTSSTTNSPGIAGKDDLRVVESTSSNQTLTAQQNQTIPANGVKSVGINLGDLPGAVNSESQLFTNAQQATSTMGLAALGLLSPPNSAALSAGSKAGLQTSSSNGEIARREVREFLAKRTDDGKLVIFKPVVRLNFRISDTRECFVKEYIFRHQYYVSGVLMGCRLEIDKDGIITYDSMTTHSERNIEKEGAGFQMKRNTDPNLSALNQTVERTEKRNLLKNAFRRAVKKTKDNLIVGKPFDDETLMAWEACVDASVPVNWEVGPVTLRKTEDVKRRYFGSKLPTCSKGHRLFLQTFEEIRWNGTKFCNDVVTNGSPKGSTFWETNTVNKIPPQNHGPKQLPCRVCGRMQKHGMETCRRRCEFYGICYECAHFWRSMDKVKREGQLLDKMNRLLAPRRKSSVLEASRVELIFPIISLKDNPVAFLRFSLALNLKYSEYVKHPFKFDTELLEEISRLCAEAGAPVDTASQMCVVGAREFRQLQCFFDILIYHPRFTELYEHSRHYREEHMRGGFLQQEANLLKLYQHISGKLEPITHQIAQLDEEPPAHVQKATQERAERLNKEKEEAARKTVQDSDPDQSRKTAPGRDSQLTVPAPRLSTESAEGSAPVRNSAVTGSSMMTMSMNPTASAIIAGYDKRQKDARVKLQVFASGYPALSKCTKIIPQCAIVARGGFDRLDMSTIMELTPQQRLVPCPMNCGEDVVDWQLDHHASKLCRKRNTSCELKCGASLRYELMNHHLSFECPHRGVICSLCKEIVLAKELKSHMMNCAYRPWKCMACGDTLPMKEKTEHAKNSCIMREIRCNWCGDSGVVYNNLIEGHKWKDCPASYIYAEELNQAIYLCRPVEEIANIINDGVHPTNTANLQQRDAGSSSVSEEESFKYGSRGSQGISSRGKVSIGGTRQQSRGTNSSSGKVIFQPPDGPLLNTVLERKLKAASGQPGSCGGYEARSSPNNYRSAFAGRSSPNNSSDGDKNIDKYGMGCPPCPPMTATTNMTNQTGLTQGSLASTAYSSNAPSDGGGYMSEPYINEDDRNGICLNPTFSPDSCSAFVGLALHAVAVVDNVDICELLLEAGADIYKTDIFGRTALHIAAMHESLEVLKILLEWEASKYAAGKFPVRENYVNNNIFLGPPLVGPAKNTTGGVVLPPAPWLSHPRRYLAYGMSGPPLPGVTENAANAAASNLLSIADVKSSKYARRLTYLRDFFDRTAFYLAGFHERIGAVDLLYDCSPYTPRTHTHVENKLHVLRYEDRRKIFDHGLVAEKKVQESTDSDDTGSS